jgi:membrane protein
MSFKETAIEVKDEVKEDNLVVAAAGLAFFGLLSLVPLLLALVSIYGIVADPDDVRRQIEDLLESSPAEIRNFVSSQMEALSGSEATGLGITVIVSILVALWSASSAVKHLMATLNQVHELEESRGFLSVRGLSLLLTFGAIIVLAGAVFLLGILPGLLANVGLGSEARYALGTIRFPGLLVLMVLSLTILYHIGPNWPAGRRFRLVTWGALLATLFWVVGSALFSIYTANVGRLNETYAATGGLVILLLFLFLTSFCVLLGAVIDEVRDRRGPGTTAAESIDAPDASDATADAPVEASATSEA